MELKEFEIHKFLQPSPPPAPLPGIEGFEGSWMPSQANPADVAQIWSASAAHPGFAASLAQKNGNAILGHATPYMPHNARIHDGVSPSKLSKMRTTNSTVSLFDACGHCAAPKPGGCGRAIQLARNMFAHNSGEDIFTSTRASIAMKAKVRQQLATFG